MTRDQVRFALGTPLIADVFHADRWDYVFVRQRADSRNSGVSAKLTTEALISDIPEPEKAAAPPMPQY